MRYQRASSRVHRRPRWPGHVRRWVAVLALAGLVACGGGGGEGEGEADNAVDLVVVAVDRTGVADQQTWPEEVAGQVGARTERAMAEGATRLELIGIGSNTQQAARVVTVDLDGVEGNTAAKRDQARRRLVESVAAAAGQVAAQPVTTSGTDVLAALEQAADLCDGPGVRSCSILLASDMEDQRVSLAASDEEAIAGLAPGMPDLDGVAVEVTGIGASGAGGSVTTRVEAVWARLFEQAGAVDVRIARSL
jgi:hypothetical protein